MYVGRNSEGTITHTQAMFSPGIVKALRSTLDNSYLMANLEQSGILQQQHRLSIVLQFEGMVGCCVVWYSIHSWYEYC